MSKRKVKPIGTIKDELADCIAAFRKHKGATHCWCCHHAKLVEKIDGDGFMQRIRFITQGKDTNEKARRFRNFRPVKSKTLRLGHADATNRRKLNKEWPQNTWGKDSRSWEDWSIFSDIGRNALVR